MDPIRFSARTLQIGKKIVDNVNDVKIEAAFAFFDRVVDTTPVHTGKAVSNWKLGLNFAPKMQRPALVPGKHGSTAGANREAVKQEALDVVVRAKEGHVIYVTNNVPYIGLLNGGRSDQAPAGFIEEAEGAAQEVIRRARLLKGL